MARFVGNPRRHAGLFECHADRGGTQDRAASSRLTTLLPEMAQQIASTHVRQTTQYRVTLERPAGASGPLKDLQISIGREGLTYIVTADGRIK